MATRVYMTATSKLKLKILLIPLLFFSQICLSQKNDVLPDFCQWYKALQTSNNQSEKLDLIKENFIPIDDFYFNGVKDKCEVLYTISVNDLYLMLSTSSAQSVRDPKAIINTIKSSEIDTIFIFDQKSSETLYGTYGVVYFKSNSKNLERRIDSIRLGKK